MGSQENGITRREWGALVATALAAAPQVRAQSGSDPVLDIAEWSYFWVGVEKISTARGTLCNGMQMYVEYWIPAQVRHPYPVVLVHGGYGQGADWISTPEGKRGWASLLVEQGYKVYVVDRPGQGRPPYFPWFHGYFDERAQTFEGVAKELGRDVNDPVVAQAVAVEGAADGEQCHHAKCLADAWGDAAGSDRSGDFRDARGWGGAGLGHRAGAAESGEGDCGDGGSEDLAAGGGG